MHQNFAGFLAPLLFTYGQMMYFYGQCFIRLETSLNFTMLIFKD